MNEEKVTNKIDKPRLYLDQNIYDLIRRGEFPESIVDFKNTFEIVYSGDTINEIEKNTSEERKHKYFEILQSLEATFMEIEVNDKFRSIDRALFHRVPISETFAWWKKNQLEATNVPKIMEKLANKLMGGLHGTTMDELIDEQIHACKDMLEKSFNDFTGNNEEKAIILKAIRQLQEVLEDTLNKMKDALKQNIKDQENFRGNKAFREIIGRGPKQLNNITQPNVIQKIWDEYAALPEIKKTGLTLEEFFNLDKHPIYPSEPYPTYNKVGILYTKLNILGYYPDQNIEKPNRFSGSLIDSNHIANGIFCDYFITSDENMFKKGSAIYEHLRIGTKIIYVEKAFKISHS